jgi:hypothetical protein
MLYCRKKRGEKKIRNRKKEEKKNAKLVYIEKGELCIKQAGYMIGNCVLSGYRK